MPSTPSVNLQQILQMGTHTEKLQHTIQNLSNVTAQQVDTERQRTDELKRNEVQVMDPSYFVEETDPETRAKKRIKVKKKNLPSDEEGSPEPPLPEDPFRGTLNIIA